MKEVRADIKDSEVLVEVKRLSANAAQQRGDALHVATDDNDALLAGFFGEVQNEIVMVLSKYAKEDSGIVFTLPDNWDSALEGVLKKRVKDAFVFGVLAKWFLLANESVYSTMFKGCIDEIHEVLNKRIRPVR